jgi:ubiquinol-cytochrome c reductase iron-sulfur subunit
MADHAQSAQGAGGTRRDFLYLMSASAAVYGTAAVVWPFISSMNPSGDVLALSSIEVDISGVQVGQAITVKWRGKPVFIRHRTEEEIAMAKKADPVIGPGGAVESNPADLRDPQTDASRVKKPEWLIVVGVCTHLGCVPLGQKPSDPRGEFGGWYCPCHGSQYDTSGRIRKGPAPLDLLVPEYAFETDTTVKIG